MWNWHIEFLCNELQTMGERVINREKKLHDLIANVCPGSTKSTIASIMFPAWLWAKDPTLRMICGSYGYNLSMYLALQCKRILDSDKYHELFPHVIIVKDSVGELHTSEGGIRIATSVDGGITGKHGHIIIIDDPIDPRNALSEVVLKSTNEWFAHTLINRKTDKEVTPLILIMQRLHQNDPTGMLLEGREKSPIRHICIPGELTDDVRPRSLRRFYKDGLFDPVRLTREVLEKLKANEYEYAGQYLQRPVPRGGGMFRPDRIAVIPSAPPLRMIVRYWDKAGSAGKGAYTVGIKMGLGKDREFVILDVVRGQWEASERERIIRQTAETDGKGVLIGVEQEPGSGGKESAQATIKNLAGWRVRLDRPTGDKALRAEPFAVQVNGGNVKMVAGLWNRAYLSELQFFPFSKYKDQVDASSGGFAILTARRLVVGGFGLLKK